MAPVPLMVVATGAPSASATASRSSPARLAPPPATIIGRSAAASRRAARDDVGVGGRREREATTACTSDASPRSSSRSSGTSRWIGRGRPLRERRERLSDGVSDLLVRRRPDAPGSDALHDAGLVLGLVQVAGARPAGWQIARHARAHEQQRNRVGVGLRHRGCGVVDRGTAGHHRDTWTSGRPRVAVGCVPAALLVRRRDRADAVARERVEHREVVGTWDAEDQADVVQRQRRDDDLSAGDAGEPW